MSVSNPDYAVSGNDAGYTWHSSILDLCHDPRLFTYPSKVMLDKRQVSSFQVWYRQQTLERIAMKEPDVYCQLSSRWLSPLCFLQESK
ncbi:MAG: hypothetical protein WAT12_00165 [Candidatus Nitrotoga sp.]